VAKILLYSSKGEEMLILLNGFKSILQILNYYRWWIFILIYVLGFFLYHVLCHFDILPALFHTASLFTLNLYTDIPPQSTYCMPYLYGMVLLAGLYTVLSVISMVAKDYLDREYVKYMQYKPYILICGLGDKASAYINSELKENNKHMLVIESLKSNVAIEKYRDKGVAVLVGNAKEKKLYDLLHLENVKHIVLLTGSDVDNLEIALRFKEILLEKNIAIKPLFIHSNDRTLYKFYKEGGLLDDTSNLEVKMFSLARNAAKNLFLKFPLDTVDNKRYMQSNATFSLVVVGSNKLAIEVIEQIMQLAYFPFENSITIYCLDSDTKVLEQTLLYLFPKYVELKTIEIKFLNRNAKEASFYEEALWHDNVTHVILCKDTAQENLDIAVELADRTYLSQIIDHTMETKIHIATYSNTMIAHQIDENNNYFKHFYAFAQLDTMASKDVIVDEKFEQIAKYIHSGYASSYMPDKLYNKSDSIDKKWYNYAKLTDRESSKAQAYHIPIKLKALGLCYVKSTIPTHQALLQHNRAILNSVIGEELKQLGLDEENLKAITKKEESIKERFTYFPDTCDLLIEKLIRVEKNRWNAHHYLKGWQYTPTQTNKPLKRHRCLIPLTQMHQEDKFTILYDLYAILYIPNLLASVGYEIRKKEEK